MRMNLYEVEIERSDRRVRGYIVAPSEELAAELVVDHDMALTQEHLGFPLARIDQSLPEHRRAGLDDVLESAPVGFASDCEPIGWIVHAAAVHKLRFFKMEDREGNETFVIAPGTDVAAAVYLTGTPLSEAPHRLFKLSEGIPDVAPEHRDELERLLEVGPIGIVEFDEDGGWSVS